MFSAAKNKASRATLLVTLMVVFAAFAVLLPLAEDANAKKKKDPSREAFTSSTRITISDDEAGSATPYPLEIAVDDRGKVADVNLKLRGLTHGRPDDVDMLVVSPKGQCAKVLSDTGGDDAAREVDLILDDEASKPLPDSTQLTSGKFKPTNYEGEDEFDNPAPEDCANTELSIFDGKKARGEWKLYVVDDMADFGGQIRKPAYDLKTLKK